MRTHLSLSALALVILASVAGCAASDGSDEAPPSGVASTDEGAVDSPTASSETAAAGGDVAGEADAVDLPETIPNQLMLTTTPTGTPPAATCVATSQRESEQNGTVATADDFNTSSTFCGSIAASTDVDYAWFILPADAKAFSWRASWRGTSPVNFTITANGVTRTSGQTPPFFPGKKYVFRVSGGGKSDYVLAIGAKK